jgi:electron transfer flavoprotein beta subunit
MFYATVKVDLYAHEVIKLNIITCIKQVPASSKVDVDPTTGVLIRDGNNVKMNPYDLYALEASFAIKELYQNATIHAVTMGPPSAKKVLEEALYMGSDEATLLSDRRFAGADVLATSYTLSQLIEHINDYEVVLCGKQTTDGDTAQVGPEMAEFLGIPHVPYVVDIIAVDEHFITVKCSYDTHEELVRVSYPCLLTIEKGKRVPRLPSYRRKVDYQDYTIPTVTLRDLHDQNPDHYGLNGSPTQVDEIFPPSLRTDSVLIKGSTQTVAQKLFELLQENKYL